MKKMISILLSLLLLVGCSSGTNSGNDEMVEVGILQFVTHDALDAAKDGFIEALKENGFEEGVNLKINYQNPEADQSNLGVMADSLIAGNLDLILAIGTTTAQTLQKANYETPILGTAITDFEGAGLVKDEKHPEGLISGVSDGYPMDVQLDLILKIVPDLKTVGVIYTSSEPNSEIQANQMIDEAKKNGLEVMVKTVSDKTMINDTLEAFNGKIDALYIPTDNNIASAMGSVAIYSKEKKLPVICGESNTVRNGGLASLGVDYFELGKQTGLMAVQILKGEKSIQDLPIEYQDVKTYYNLNTADAIGIELPASIIENGIDVNK